MNDQNAGNTPANGQDEVLLAQRGGQYTVRGTADMMKTDARVFWGDGGHLTISSPTLPIGGNPKEILSRHIVNNYGDDWAIKIGNNLLENDKLFSRGYQAGTSGFGLDFQNSVVITPGVQKELMQNIQLNWDIQYAQQMNRWARENPNGAQIAVGDTIVKYDRETVKQIEQNSREMLNNLIGPVGPRRRAEGESDQTVAVANAELVPGQHPLNDRFKEALKDTGNPDQAARAIQSLREHPQFDEKKEIQVVQNDKGQLYAVQGKSIEDPSAVIVAVPQAQPVDRGKLSESIAAQPAPSTTQTANAQTTTQPAVNQETEQPQRSRIA
jgi:hypothetical protein